MTLKKAIELLKKDIDDPGSVDIQDLAVAEQLGIEALKEWEKHRKGMTQLDIWLLPAETRE